MCIKKRLGGIKYCPKLRPVTLIKFFQKEVLEAGCDEAGRGCLAGPVFAAAVILDADKRISGLDDSKKLSERDRLALKEEIEEKALCFGVASLSNEEIDQVNILKASFFAMHRALDRLEPKPGLLLIDGNRFTPYQSTPYRCEIKGDGRFQSIAAASILAKTYRDAFMENLHLQFPHYGWLQNKGYPTKAHRLAIRQYGPCAYHRMSFKLLEEQLQLF